MAESELTSTSVSFREPGSDQGTCSLFEVFHPSPFSKIRKKVEKALNQYHPNAKLDGNEDGIEDGIFKTIHAWDAVVDEISNYILTGLSWNDRKKLIAAIKQLESLIVKTENNPIYKGAFGFSDSMDFLYQANDFLHLAVASGKNDVEALAQRPGITEQERKEALARIERCHQERKKGTPPSPANSINADDLKILYCVGKESPQELIEQSELRMLEIIREDGFPSSKDKPICHFIHQLLSEVVEDFFESMKKPIPKRRRPPYLRFGDIPADGKTPDVIYANVRRQRRQSIG